MKSVFAAILLTVLAGLVPAKAAGAGLGAVAVTGLTKPQAEAVLRLVIAQGVYRRWLHSRHSYIENLDQAEKQAVPGFFMFRLAYDAPQTGATAYAGPYLISQKTADVWDVGDPGACKNLHFPALARWQAQVTRKTQAKVQDEAGLRAAFDCFD